MEGSAPMTDGRKMIIEHHHEMPKRWDKGMSVKRLMARLKGHPPKLPIHGSFRVDGERERAISAEEGMAVGEVRKLLKRHEGKQMAAVDLTVVADLRRGRDWD